MRLADFDYVLPPERIAQTPVEPRDASRLLVLNRAGGLLQHRHFRDLPDFLRAGDLLVCNDSRVLPARLFGTKETTGGKVEVFLLRKQDERRWEALVRGRLPDGSRVIVGNGAARLGCRIVAALPSGARQVEFDAPVEPLLPQLGHVPLPPYIHAPLADADRYQTVYARVQGSVAAPTAGLHFTPGLIDRLREMGVDFAFVTLHIGLDTFRPVQEDDVTQHPMHAEWISLAAATAAQIRRTRAAGGRVVAIGTTAVRVLESVAQQTGDVQAYEGWTRLFILPGYRFRLVDALVTNFHLPRSTLLMLVAAFAGHEAMQAAYQAAVQGDYRFYSFGDAMLIL